MMSPHRLPAPPAHDDLATSEYHRGPPLPLRPTLLAPQPRFPQLPQPRPELCPTCPFRQVSTPAAPPPAPSTHAATVTQLLPAASAGSTTIMQAVAPAPPRRRPPPPPPRRSYLPHLQLALWLVITLGLLILVVRTL